MKRTLVMMAFVAISATAVNAQVGKTHFSVGVELGKPVGTGSKPYASIVGGSAEVEHMVSSAMGITGNVGFQWHGVSDDYKPLGVKAYNVIPVKAGFRYYFDKFFVNAQVGAAIPAEEGLKTAFIYTAGPGYKISNKVSLAANFQGISYKSATMNAIVARLAYMFN